MRAPCVFFLVASVRAPALLWSKRLWFIVGYLEGTCQCDGLAKFHLDGGHENLERVLLWVD